MAEENIKSQMRKGILEYCVLLYLAQTEAYPAEILAKLKEAQLIVVEGTLYTLLNRLRREEKLNYVWEESPSGPPRKYFSITEAGRNSLLRLQEEWDEVASTVNYFRNLNQQTSETNEKDL